MFDWLRSWRKSDEEKKQEAVTAYLDRALSPREMREFESRLGEDSALQAELEAQRQVKNLLSQMPRLKAPRNFTLDPAVYGRTRPVRFARLYPQLRAATLIATLLFVFSLTLNLLPRGLSGGVAAPESESVAVLSEPAEAPTEGFAAEVEEAAAMEPAAAEESVEDAAAAVMEDAQPAAAPDERPVEEEGEEAEMTIQTESLIIEEEEVVEEEVGEELAEAEPPAEPSPEMTAATAAGGQAEAEVQQESEAMIIPQATSTVAIGRQAATPAVDQRQAGEIASSDTAEDNGSLTTGTEPGAAASPEMLEVGLSPLGQIQLFLGAVTLLLLLGTLYARRRW